MRQVWGDSGATFISLLIAVATAGSANTTIITGARSSYALGRDFSWFSFLGRWNPKANNPTNALLVQAAIALALVAIGTMARDGFKTMVEYTAPIFWSFFLLTGVSLFRLRFKEEAIFRPFRVPLYPITPLLFCAICIYMLYSSLAYTGIGALVGVAVLLAGVIVFLLEQFLRNKTEGRSQKIEGK
jgi:APA family basic amino acid/polyamine antiporter